jgi:hypothetical protein
MPPKKAEANNAPRKPIVGRLGCFLFHINIKLELK